MNKLAETSCTCGCGELNEKTKSQGNTNLPGLSSLRFLAGTHGSFKAEMLKALSANPALRKLSARNDEDFSVATIDGWATVLDVLTFYQERIINEGYLRTATERLSVVELARHLSYKPGPGVAAGTFFAFKMNESAGAPTRVTIPAGTKVQSIPGQNQLPQIFETTGEFEARVEWNAIGLQTKKKVIPVIKDKEIYLKGVNNGLMPGDGLLMIGDERRNDAGNENWDFRRISTVVTDPVSDYTKVTWDKGLGASRHGVTINPASKNFKVYAMRQRASLFGYNAPDFRTMSEIVKDAFNPDTQHTENTNTDWLNFSISGISYPGANPSVVDTIHLDGLYPKISKNSWLVIRTEAYEEVYQVASVAESSRKDFTLASKTMAVKLSGENLKDKFNSHVRDAVIFAQSEELELAEKPIPDAIKNRNELRLQKLVPDLAEGMMICITGKRQRLMITESVVHNLFTVDDNPTATRKLVPYDSLIILSQPETLANGRKKWHLLDSGGFEGTVQVAASEYTITPAGEKDPVVNELHTIKTLTEGVDPTVIVLEEQIENYFDPATVAINLNIVAATHGETKTETLGSGNGSQVFQKFYLKQSPLTFISAETPSGTMTTLEIRVNDILWEEVPTFYGRTAKEKIYTTFISDDGTVTVQFGDGITGSRLPTGTENVRASYRVGIGSPGLLDPGQLSMLLTPQPGISKVENPLTTSGAADAETLADARRNVPLTVLTLDRIVSARDFEDFTRAFAGIGKARADILWNGERQVIYLTIASGNAGPVDKESSLFQNLQTAINKSGHSNSIVLLENYKALTFSISARIAISAGYNFETVKGKVLQALTDTFSFMARDFGQDVTPSEVIAVIQSVEGVGFTDLELLNDKDPALMQHFRLTANVATSHDGVMKPAELLTINPDNIILTEILS